MHCTVCSASHGRTPAVVRCALPSRESLPSLEVLQTAAAAPAAAVAAAAAAVAVAVAASLACRGLLSPSLTWHALAYFHFMSTLPPLSPLPPTLPCSTLPLPYFHSLPSSLSLLRSRRYLPASSSSCCTLTIFNLTA